MSNEFGSGAAARDAGVARIRKLTRGAIVCAALLSGAFAGLAAASTHVRKANRAGTNAAAVPAPTPAPAPSSAAVPLAPAQAPSQSTAPPVASSGGS